MPSFNESIAAEIEPVWATALGALGALYAIWPVLSLYETLVRKTTDGYGWFPFLIFAFMAYVITLAIVGGLLGRVFHRIESHLMRGLIALALIAIFAGVHGVPHAGWWPIIAFVGASACFQSRKARADARDREEFFNG